MILKPGENIHVIHRQRFEGDFNRHFVGTLEHYQDCLVRVTGYVFAIATNSNKYVKRETPRTRIIHLADQVLVNVIPPDVVIEKITYTYSPNGDVVVSDGSAWMLELSKTSA